MYFDFYTTVSVTSNAYAINTDASTTFIGGCVNMVIDNNATTEANVGNAASHVKISMNGTTTGGLIGTEIRVFATSTTTWASTGVVVGSGSIASPYA